MILETDDENELKKALLELDCVCSRHGLVTVKWVCYKKRMVGYCSECLREDMPRWVDPCRLHLTPNIVKMKDAE